MTTAGDRGRRMTELRDTLAAHVRMGAVPGVLALVSRGDETHVEALGTLTLGGEIPVERDTIFRISSMTKPITAAAAMLLVEEGRLTLDEPVTRLAPELASRRVLTRLDALLHETVPAAREITVRDLLDYRMGFGIVLAPPDTYPIQRAERERRLGQGMPAPASMPPPDEWMRRFGELPLLHQPGEAWDYNTGSDILGVIVARASGQSFRNFLIDRLFEPLGMRDTDFFVPAGKQRRFAASYVVDPATGKLSLYDAAHDGQWSSLPAFSGGASGLVSTADDFHAFAKMLLEGGVHSGKRILAERSIQAMTTDHLTEAQRATGRVILGEDRGWGFGVGVMKDGRYGWDGGLGTSWMTDPRTGLVGIVLTQAAFTSPAPPAVCADFWRVAPTVL